MNKIVKTIVSILSPLLTVAIIFLVGVALAAVAKKTTFTEEWANMIAWFSTWAK